MHKQDPKIQTCVLRVNIHCEGCKHKVKKKLQKVEGVYKVNIDVEQSKVTVSGNVDPEILINKLEKSGKHAEMWGPQQKGPISILSSNQFKNFQIDNKNGGGKDSKPQKGFKEQKKGGVQLPQQMHLKKGSNKDVKIVGKNQNSVRFNLPEDEEDYDDSDNFEDDDEDFDDGSDDGGFAAHRQHPSKGAPLVGGHHKSNKATPKKDHVKGKNGDNDGGNMKKSGGINTFLKGMLGKAGGKNGKVGNGHDKAGNEKESSKKNGKKDSFEHGEGKNGGKSKDSWSKKGGEKFDGKHKMEGNKKHGFNEMNLNNRGGGGGGGGGDRSNGGGMGGQVGDFQGLPKTTNGGNFQGNPYNQQQMAMMMMMMNQQNANRAEGYHPMGYAARPPPPMGYGQPPMPPAMGYGPQSMPPAMGYGPPPPTGNDQYTHIFSDENTDSCSIM